MPVLAKKGNYVLVSYVENRIIILNEDDEPRQLLPFHDGTWVGFETLSVSGGRIPCRLMDLDPSQDVYEILRRSWAVRNDIGIGDVLVISEYDDIETVDKKVGDVLRAWGYPGRKPLAMCEHIEAI